MQTKPKCFIVQDTVAKNFLFSLTTQKIPFLGLKMERDEVFFLKEKKETCTDEEYLCVESHKNPARENIGPFNNSTMF